MVPMWIVAVLLICCAFFVAEFMANLSKQFKEIAESEMKKSK